VTRPAKGKLRNAPASEQGNTLLCAQKHSHKPVFISDECLNTHMLVTGTTGAGKTVTVCNVVESFIGRGLPVIYIDGKGDLSLAKKIMEYAQGQGRDARLFSMVGESCRYNPLASGGYSSKKDRLIEMREWSEDHYRKLAEDYLQIVFKVLEICRINVDLLSVAKYFSRNEFSDLLREKIDFIGDALATGFQSHLL